MRAFLKIFLWVLAIFGLVMVVAVVWFGVVVYKQVDKHVLQFSCADLVARVNDLPTDMQRLEQSVRKGGQPLSRDELMDLKMKPMGVVMTVMGYATVREGGTLDEAMLRDAAKWERYASEVYAICKANPDVRPLELAEEVKAGKAPSSALLAKLDGWLKDVKVEPNDQVRLYVALVMESIREKLETARRLEALVSSTVAISGSAGMGEVVPEIAPRSEP